MSRDSLKLGAIIILLFACGLIIITTINTLSRRNLSYIHITSAFANKRLDKQSQMAELRSAQKLLLSLHTSESNLDHELSNRLSQVSFLLGDFELATAVTDTAKKQESPNTRITTVSAEDLLIESLVAQLRGDSSDAIAYFREALALQPQEVETELYIRYYQMLLANDESTTTSSLILSAINNPRDDGTPLLTDYQLETLNAPSITVNCWQLTDIQYDRAALNTGPIVPVRLHWENQDTDYKLIQEELIINLVPNAGFEWGLANGNPIGFPHTIYNEDDPSKTHSVEIDNNPFSSSTATLSNNQEFINTSFASNPITIDSSDHYFVGALIKSENGNVTYGVRHQMHQGTSPGYTPIASSITSTQWDYYGEILQFPDSVKNVALWLLNYQSTGKGYYDDLLFFEIDIPEC